LYTAHLAYWLLAYSSGIAGLTVSIIYHRRMKIRESREVFRILLSFSVLTVSASLVYLNDAVTGGFRGERGITVFLFILNLLFLAGVWAFAVSLPRFFLLFRPARKAFPRKAAGGLAAIGLAGSVLFSLLHYAAPRPLFRMAMGICQLTLFTAFTLSCLYSFSRMPLLSRGDSPEPEGILRILSRGGLIFTGGILFYDVIWSSYLKVRREGEMSYFLFLPGFYIFLNLCFGIFLQRFHSLRENRAGLDEEKLAACGITPREREVIELLIRGTSYQQIAETLGISPATVQSHAGRIYKKTGTGNKVELSLFCRP